MTGQGSRQQETAGGVLGTVKETAQNLASSAASTAENAWEATREMAGNVGSTVANAAEDAWDSVTSCMRRYPLATFACGVGLGMLLALALRPPSFGISRGFY